MIVRGDRIVSVEAKAPRTAIITMEVKLPEHFPPYDGTSGWLEAVTNLVSNRGEYFSLWVSGFSLTPTSIAAPMGEEPAPAHSLFVRLPDDTGVEVILPMRYAEVVNKALKEAREAEQKTRWGHLLENAG